MTIKEQKETSSGASASSSASQHHLQQQQQQHLGVGDRISSVESSPNKRLAKQYVDINGDVLVLTIERRGRPSLGLSLAGNRDASIMSVFVCGIRPDGAAAADGRLRIGDELLEVNGHVLLGKSHLNAVPLINDACCGGGAVRLVVVRRPTNIDAMAVRPILPPRSLPVDYSSASPKQPDTLITPTEMEMLAEGAIDSDQLLLMQKTAAAAAAAAADAAASATEEATESRIGPYGLEIDCVLIKGKLGLGFAITEGDDDNDNGGGGVAQPSVANGGDAGEHRSSGVLVKHLTERGPAETEGSLRPGDRLLRANDVSLATASYDEALDCLRSLPAGEVHLTVARQQQKQQQPILETPAAAPAAANEIAATDLASNVAAAFEADSLAKSAKATKAMDESGGGGGLETLIVEIDKGEGGTLGLGIVGGADTGLVSYSLRLSSWLINHYYS